MTCDTQKIYGNVIGNQQMSPLLFLIFYNN